MACRDGQILASNPFTGREDSAIMQTGCYTQKPKDFIVGLTEISVFFVLPGAATRPIREYFEVQ